MFQVDEQACWLFGCCFSISVFYWSTRPD